MCLSPSFFFCRVHFCFCYIFMGWVCFLLVQYYKEFISLRQAHDERLVRSAELGRRTSLLDSEQQSSQQSMQQIMSKMRKRLSMVSGSWGGSSAPYSSSLAGGVGSGDDMAGKHITVRFSYGQPSAELGPGGAQPLDRGAPSSSSFGSRLGTLGPMAVPSGQAQPIGSIGSSSSVGMHPESRLRLRSRGSSVGQGDSRADTRGHGSGISGGTVQEQAVVQQPQQQSQQQPQLPEQPQEPAQQEHQAVAQPQLAPQPRQSSGQEPPDAGRLTSQGSSLSSTNDEGEVLVAAQHRNSTAAVLEGIAEGEDGAEDSPSPALAATAAAAAAAAAADGRGPPTGGHDVALSITQGPFQTSSLALKGPPSKNAGGKASGTGASGSGARLEWDELAQPNPLLQAADAAQFYTVLVVDEALEDFSYRRACLWVSHPPSSLGGQGVAEEGLPTCARPPASEKGGGVEALAGGGRCLHGKTLQRMPLLVWEEWVDGCSGTL